MRSLILVAALLTSGAAIATESSTFQMSNADDLVRICSVAPSDPFYANATGFCHGILFGSYRFYDSWVSAEKRFVCPPTPAQTRAEVMNGFVAWARSHPQYMKDPAVDTLFRYLAEAYPCKK